MDHIVRYLSHPQVRIQPDVAVDRWSLDDTGRARMAALTGAPALAATTRVVSSAEAKAVETAAPLAGSLGVDVEIRSLMHENDRSATGYLPPEEFEATADRFFAEPDNSVRGWETARVAQARIVAEVEAVLEDHSQGDILLVGHGGVGTLLYCALCRFPISRRHDQPPGGGNFFAFALDGRKPLSGWQLMESLLT